MSSYDGSDKLDTSNETFLAVTTILPLLCEIENKNISTIITNRFTSDFVKRILNREKTGTTLPYERLPYDTDKYEINNVATRMASSIKNEYGGLQTRFHIFNELIGNIYNHTPLDKNLASQAHTLVQEYPNVQKLDICIMDDGISISGGFDLTNIGYDDECHAIEKAISGTSSIQDKDRSRGLGLRTTIKLVVEGNGGSILIVSGKGCLYIENEDNYKYKFLDNDSMFKGTLVSVRLNKNEVQNYYNFIEIDNVNPYKY